jgi:probable HAF family extracellular repeat protein
MTWALVALKVRTKPSQEQLEKATKRGRALTLPLWASLPMSVALMAPLAAAELPKYAMRDLGELGGYFSQGNAINDAGLVAGEARTTPGGPYHAIVVGAGQPMLDLGTFGGNYSAARGINNSGQVAGTARASNGIDYAFVVKPGDPMVNLGSLGGAGSNGMGSTTPGRSLAWRLLRTDGFMPSLQAPVSQWSTSVPWAGRIVRAKPSTIPGT